MIIVDTLPYAKSIQLRILTAPAKFDGAARPLRGVMIILIIRTNNSNNSNNSKDWNSHVHNDSINHTSYTIDVNMNKHLVVMITIIVIVITLPPLVSTR